ncbi:hypothetical protein H310_07586 [Aphanomyces invadans]|uniref:Uncharacterized protein n=1 Tax=Aphanomyces invadans TaxID=157072 RepID=A0A024U176_9STRA|nr:hypothetical protein H310_07586 [Aphanomyces invadans]ETW00186.1 hypothetical protein H310_07586 [Aphanomyces invadans]|eukprot:XP_008871211.1 hypothetical protein H310_07586 [Aphanomyces invadans]
MVLKSGKLEKVVNQQVFQGAKSKVIPLNEFTVSMLDERKVHRKYCFQLTGKQKQKNKIFACSNDRECREWVAALLNPHVAKPSNQVDDNDSEENAAVRRAKAAFAKVDAGNTGAIDSARLHELLDTMSFQHMHTGWQVDQLGAIQLALDPNKTGKIPRDLFATWARAHFDDSFKPAAPPAASTLPAPSKPSDVTDWNGMYWELLQSDSPVVPKGLSMSHMMKEFRDAADSFAQSVVDNLVVHPTPSSTVDVHSAKRSLVGYPDCALFAANGLYAVVYHPSTQQVVKSLGHDIRSSRVVLTALDAVDGAATDLAVPVQCVVDYMGVRVLVVAELFQARTCEVAPDTHAAASLRRVLHHLHMCDLDNNVADILPVDVHLVQCNGRLVLTKLRHLCAPDVLHELDDGSVDAPTQHHLAALTSWKLRPEYIRQYHTPLHSNVYRGRLSPVQDNIVACASHYMQMSILPACVHRLESTKPCQCGSRLIDSGAFTAMLHADGINMRYLGRIYELATLKHVRRLVLSEMVARVAKVLLRAMLREAPTQWRPLVVDLFNVLCGAGSESAAFYANEIEPTLDLKFGVIKSNLRHELHMPQLFLALQYHTGVQFETTVSYVPLLDQVSHPFRAQNVLAIKSTVSLACSTTTACLDMIHQGSTLHDDMTDEEVDACLTNIKLALAIEQACPTDSRHVRLCHLLVQAAEVSVRVGAADDADTFASLALEEGPVGHAVLSRAHVVLMQLHHAKQDMQSALREFDKAIETATWHVGPCHPFILTVLLSLVNIWVDRQDWLKALDILEQCTTVVKEAYGRYTLQFAQHRCQQAELLRLVGNLDQAISMYEDALAIYEEDSTCVVKSADCCSAMTAILLELPSLQPAFNMAMKAHELRVASADNDAILASWMQLGACSKALKDDFRAIEYYKSALAVAKANQATISNAVQCIQDISRELLALVFQTLSPDAKQCVSKVNRKDKPVSSELLAFVVAQLYALDVPQYLDLLFQDLLRDSGTPSAPMFDQFSSDMQLRAAQKLLDL